MKTKITIIIISLLALVILGYNTYLNYQIYKMNQFEVATINFLFTPDTNKLDGFTKILANSINIISQGNQQQPNINK